VKIPTEEKVSRSKAKKLNIWRNMLWERFISLDKVGGQVQTERDLILFFCVWLI